MKTGKDISVPRGYFETLQERLEKIPAASDAPVSGGRRSFAGRLSPYLAFAASIAAVALIGTFILSRTAVTRDEESFEEWSFRSYLAQSLDADGLLPQWQEYTLTEQDIVSFLVDDGLTLEELVSYEEDY